MTEVSPQEVSLMETCWMKSSWLGGVTGCVTNSVFASSRVWVRASSWFSSNSVSYSGLQPRKAPVCTGASEGSGSTRFQRRFRRRCGKLRCTPTLGSTGFRRNFRRRFYTPQFTLSKLHSTIYALHFTLYSLHSAFYTLHFTLYTAHCTLYTPHLTLYTPIPHSKLYIPHSTPHTPHSTLHI